MAKGDAVRHLGWMCALLLSGCAAAESDPPARVQPAASQSAAGQTFAPIKAPKDRSARIDPPRIEVAYADKIDGDEFRLATLARDGTLVRTLRGSEEYGYFENQGGPELSADHAYLILTRVAIGYVDDEEGLHQVLHEVVHCDIVATATGCLISSQMGGFCLGHFDGDTFVNEHGTQDLTRTPKRTSTFAEGADSDDPVYSQENLKFCEAK